MKTWTCQRDGACCQIPGAVVMTTAEWDELRDQPARRPAQVDLSRPGLVALKARPCPFYDPHAKACMVYEKRPYNCRVFMCGRWDVTKEPFADNVTPKLRADNDLRWTFLKSLPQHSEWARAHGIPL